MSNAPDPIYSVENLCVRFPLAQPFSEMIAGKERPTVRAVDGVNFSIRRGEILSLVGESGSGKSTIGKALLRLLDPKVITGSVCFEGKDVSTFSKTDLTTFRQRAQMIFQDPYQALNSKLSNFYQVAEPLYVNHLTKTKEELYERVRVAMDQAGLRPPESYMGRFPHELSGGQRQRIAIAGAMVMNPDFLVADEPVSMLDVSIRADILKLIVGLREERGVSCLFITHDLSLAWLISDRIAILYLGKIMEIGKAEEIAANPLHPYTQSLLSIMPKLELRKEGKRELLSGEIPNPTEAPKGCRFSSRGPHAMKRCSEEEPAMSDSGEGHLAACFLLDEKKA